MLAMSTFGNEEIHRFYARCDCGKDHIALWIAKYDRVAGKRAKLHIVMCPDDGELPDE